MIESILSIKSNMAEICTLINIDNLSISHYEKLEELKGIFDIYSHQIKRFEMKDSKLSDVLPSMLNLIVTLKNSNGNFSELTNALMNDLVKRCRCIFDHTSSQFNLIYALSTYLDPYTRKYLSIKTNQFDLPELKTIVTKRLSSAIAERRELTLLPKKSKLLDGLGKLITFDQVGQRRD